MPSLLWLEWQHRQLESNDRPITGERHIECIKPAKPQSIESCSATPPLSPCLTLVILTCNQHSHARPRYTQVTSNKREPRKHLLLDWIKPTTSGKCPFVSHTHTHTHTQESVWGVALGPGPFRSSHYVPLVSGRVIVRGGPPTE